MGETTGFVKFIADAKTDELLGAHMIGPNVSELIAEVVLGVRVSRVVGGHRHHGARAPDAFRGDEGSGARGARPRDPHLVAVAAIVVRPLMPAGCRVGARRSSATSFAARPYLDRVIEVLESALQFEDPEFLCLLAGRGRGRTCRTGSCCSAPSSARGWPRRCTQSCPAIPSCSSRSWTPCARPACAPANDSSSASCRTIAPFDVSAIALVARGFREEGRVDDLVREGVALRLLVWRPGGRANHA